MNSGDRTKLTNHLKTNLATVRGTLTVPALLPKQQEDNYATIKTLLETLKASAVHDNVVEAAKMIGKAQQGVGGLGLVIISIKQPPPPVDVPKEVKKITDGSAFAVEIDGIYVSLDNDQRKHQPKSVPIGNRVAEGEKFGTYATTAWHETNTMAYMAEWAEGLDITVEGETGKVYHGQHVRVPNATAGNVCYEAYCVLLGGKKYVSFHCYPNSK
jgi:hypothetical protein